MAIDEQLISRNNRNAEEADNSENESGADKAGTFNARKQADARVARGLPVDGLPIGGIQGVVAKRILAAAKRKQAQSADGESSGSGNEVTSKLLKSAWQNIIPTWGLSILWIDIHIFLSQVLGKDLFCSLGQEWFPKGTPRNLYGAKKSVGMTEGMAVGCLNVGLILLILGVVSVIALMVNGITNPMDILKTVLGKIWCAVATCKG